MRIVTGLGIGRERVAVALVSKASHHAAFMRHTAIMAAGMPSMGKREGVIGVVRVENGDRVDSADAGSGACEKAKGGCDHHLHLPGALGRQACNGFRDTRLYPLTRFPNSTQRLPSKRIMWSCRIGW